jgi:hypothetical protein
MAQRTVPLDEPIFAAGGTPRPHDTRSITGPRHRSGTAAPSGRASRQPSSDFTGGDPPPAWRALVIMALAFHHCRTGPLMDQDAERDVPHARGERDRTQADVARTSRHPARGRHGVVRTSHRQQSRQTASGLARERDRRARIVPGRRNDSPPSSQSVVPILRMGNDSTHGNDSWERVGTTHAVVLRIRASSSASSALMPASVRV